MRYSRHPRRHLNLQCKKRRVIISWCSWSVNLISVLILNHLITFISYNYLSLWWTWSVGSIDWIPSITTTAEENEAPHLPWAIIIDFVHPYHNYCVLLPFIRPRENPPQNPLFPVMTLLCRWPIESSSLLDKGFQSVGRGSRQPPVHRYLPFRIRSGR